MSIKRYYFGPPLDNFPEYCNVCCVFPNVTSDLKRSPHKARICETKMRDNFRRVEIIFPRKCHNFVEKEKVFQTFYFPFFKISFRMKV